MNERMQLPEIDIIDAYKAHMRQLFNTSGGKRGMWLRARDGVRVPPWFVKYWKGLTEGK